MAGQWGAGPAQAARSPLHERPDRRSTPPHFCVCRLASLTLKDSPTYVEEGEGVTGNAQSSPSRRRTRQLCVLLFLREAPF
jgi:hypothetical protein